MTGRTDWRVYLVAAIIGLAMLLPHLWVRDWHIEPEQTRMVDPGCVGDFTTGMLECSYIFTDGSWIRKRGY